MLVNEHKLISKTAMVNLKGKVKTFCFGNVADRSSYWKDFPKTTPSFLYFRFLEEIKNLS